MPRDERGVRVETPLDLAAPDQGSLRQLSDLIDTPGVASAGSNRAFGAVKHALRRSES